MILLSVFSSLQIWDSLPKPAVFFTSLCDAYFNWLCITLWVSRSAICFLGAQRTFDSFNGTLHSFLFSVFLPLLFLLPIPPRLPLLFSFIYSTFIPTSCPLLSCLCLLFHPLHLLPPSPFSHQFPMPFPYFVLPPPSLTPPFSLFRSGDYWQPCTTEALPHTLLQQWQIYGTWIFTLCSMCCAYCALCPVIILFLCSCQFSRCLCEKQA